MSYLLPHLRSGWSVDQAILAEEDRAVVIRFGHDWDQTCMQMDEVWSWTTFKALVLFEMNSQVAVIFSKRVRFLSRHKACTY